MTVAGPPTILAFHLLYFLGVGAAIVLLILRGGAGLWLTMVFGFVAGVYLEMGNGLFMAESIVVYPQPHLLTLPGSQIPLSVVLGWGAFPVLIRALSRFAAGSATKNRTGWPVALIRLLSLVLVAFASGFVIEFVATAMGGWVYRAPPGPLPFPLWPSGPTMWLVVVLLTTGTSEAALRAVWKVAGGFGIRHAERQA